MKRIKEVVIVEGKNDSSKIKKIFPNIETFETNGFNLDKKKINLIKEINIKRGIICFLDPDDMGKKIRNILIKEFPNSKQAFISLNDINKKSKKKGIAEANDDAIINALNNLFSLEDKPNNITWEKYLLLNLNTKNKRIKICDKLNIPYYNHKQLFNILKIIGIEFNELNRMVYE